MDEERIIYFDNNATTAVAPEVFEAMTPFLTKLYGNPSSIHHFGGQVAQHIEDARDSLAALGDSPVFSVEQSPCKRPSITGNRSRFFPLSVLS